MEITFIGHACFLVKFSTGLSVCFDPYVSGYVPGLADTDVAADEVFCSHSHRDHCDFESVRKPEEPYMGTEPEIDILRTFHDDVQGAARGRNNITIVKSGSEKIVHMGDIGCDLSEEQLDRIRGCDLLMIPVGGFFTINCRQAYRMCEQIKPKAVVPMHFRGATFGYDQISGREEFIKLCEDDGTREIVNAGSFIGSLPDGKTLLVMDPLRA
ncbi:MAG: MBL fold metallo-hydrolase [Clostridiales bacterium]|nr:MBL fold metallo-hydrolase [Clostridiales bacterium]MBR4948615.1 MBL fold metallo-hydrolase [Clostridiales bacterium]